MSSGAPKSATSWVFLFWGWGTALRVALHRGQGCFGPIFTCPHVSAEECLHHRNWRMLQIRVLPPPRAGSQHSADRLALTVVKEPGCPSCCRWPPPPRDHSGADGRMRLTPRKTAEQ